MLRFITYLTAIHIGVSAASLVFRHQFHALLPTWWADALIGAWIAIGVVFLFVARNAPAIGRLRC